jgi:hypothetical protein
MASTTNKDLYLTAHAAAVANSEVTDALTLDRNAIAAFTAAGHDDRDYGRWLTTYRERQKLLLDLAKQPAPSTADDAETARKQTAAENLVKKPAAKIAPVAVAPSVAPLPKPVSPAPAAQAAAPQAVPAAQADNEVKPE